MSQFTLIQRLRNKIKLRGRNNIIKVDDKSSLNMSGSSIYLKGDNNSLHIMKNVRIKNSNIEIIGDNCSITIGNGCMIGYNSYLSAKEVDIHIAIGDDCGFSRNVKLMTSDGHYIYEDGKRINHPKSIHIHNKVWIADNVTILKGVEIGSNSIVGINSLVTKNIPNNAIAAGNPAIIRKENITWEP